MSIATHAIKYGWVYLATLTLGTGTIFMADPILRRITLHDRIEVTMAVVERCIAAGVTPPSIVRTWTDTNGVSVIMTNALAWRDDLSMKVELDDKIKAIVPSYVDPVTLQALTVTGLWASLNIGDGTNKFTQTPAIGTNTATYGPWAWRNYIVAWGERYKVLYSLNYINNPLGYTVTNWAKQGEVRGSTGGWNNAKSVVDANMSAHNVTVGLTATAGLEYYTNYPPEDRLYYAYKFVWEKSKITFSVPVTNATIDWFVSLKAGSPIAGSWGRFAILDRVRVYDANDTQNIIPTNYYKWGTLSVNSTGEYSIEADVSSDAVWCDAPTDATGHARYIGYAYYSEKGFRLFDQKLFYRYGPAFNYCTNKYW